MRRYLLDSGIASDYIERREPVYSRVADDGQRRHRVGLCIPVVAELFAGVELSSRERNGQRLNRTLATIVIWPFDRAAAEEYGRIYASLRRAGRPIQHMDMQIAAIALSLGNCTVLSKDSDFAAVPALTIEDWSA